MTAKINLNREDLVVYLEQHSLDETAKYFGCGKTRILVELQRMGTTASGIHAAYNVRCADKFREWCDDVGIEPRSVMRGMGWIARK